MTLTINNKAAGTEASGAAAAAVVDLAPVLAAIATASAVPGEVREFALGYVPAAWAQIAGTTTQLVAGSTSAQDLRLIANAPAFNEAQYVFPMPGGGYLTVRSLASANGGSTTVCTYSAAFALLSQTASIQNYMGMQPYVYLSNNKLLRIGGAFYSSGLTTGLVQLFDVVTKTWTDRAASRDTQLTGRFAEAGDGCVYGTAVAASAAAAQILDKYDVATNVWTLGFDTPPLPAQKVVGAVKLPSGKILFAYADAQYVFNPAAALGSRWALVGNIAGVRATDALRATATGVEIYMPTCANYGAVARLAVAVATEAGWTWNTYATDNTAITSIYAKVSAYPAPAGGVCISQDTTTVMLTHNINYTPKQTVLAAKV